MKFRDDSFGGFDRKQDVEHVEKMREARKENIKKVSEGNRNRFKIATEDTPLNKMQEHFVEEYMSDPTVTQGEAGIRAGYSPNTANQIGLTLLKKPHIKKAIEVRREKLREKFEISRERVLQEYAAIAFSDVTQFYDETVDKQGKIVRRLKPLSKLNCSDRNSTLAIKNIQFTAMSTGEVVTKAIDFHDKVRALDSLAKYLGLFEEDNKQKHAIINMDDVINGLPNPAFAEKVRKGLVERMILSDSATVN